MAEDDGAFDDEDFNDLDEGTLVGLENEAIQFTQHQQVRYESSDYGEEDLDEEDLEEVDVIDDGRAGTSQVWDGMPRMGNLPPRNSAIPRSIQPEFGRPAIPPRGSNVYIQPQRNVQPVNFQVPTRVNPNSVYTHSQRSVQPVRPQVTPANSAQREQFRQQRYGNTTSTQLIANGSQSTQRQLHTTAQHATPHSQRAPITLEELQRQLDELVNENNALKVTANVKSGEAAIVRRKLEEAEKKHQLEVERLKKLGADEMDRQKRVIDEAKAAGKKAADDFKLLKFEMEEELRKATGKLNKAPTTPTKGKLSHGPAYPAHQGDGFDNVEASPSKAKRLKPGTPSKATGKRKRKPESPITGLEVCFEQPAVVEAEQRPSMIIDAELVERLGRQDERLDFLENMLNHRPYRGHPRTFDAFAKYFFPSLPHESLSSIIFSELPSLNSKKSTEEFPIDFCELILSLWTRCLQESYTKPIYLIIDLLTHALNLKTLAITPHILDSLLPLAQSTIDLVAIPRFKQEPIPSELAQDISTTSCLSLLYLTSLGCVSRAEHLVRFWRLIRLDIILMNLSPYQPPSDFTLMIQLLRMSVLRENRTIGPVSTDPETQDKNTGYIIERVTARLADPPLQTPIKPPPNNQDGQTQIKSIHDLSPLEEAQLRLQILTTITAFSRIQTGGRALAKHTYVIGRLVSIISSTMDSLYNYHGGKKLHDVNSEIVTMATKLLHTLCKGYEAEAGMIQDKLAVVKGGTHRHLVALARLALRDEDALGSGLSKERGEEEEEPGDLVLEEMIGVGVGEYAKELLEIACTMEEADAIHEALIGND